MVCVIWSQSATSNPSSVVGTYAGCEKDELQRHRGELESGTRLSSPTVGSRLSFCLVVLEKKGGCSVPPKGNNARFVWYRLFCHTPQLTLLGMKSSRKLYLISWIRLEWNGLVWFGHQCTSSSYSLIWQSRLILTSQCDLFSWIPLVDGIPWISPPPNQPVKSWLAWMGSKDGVRRTRYALSNCPGLRACVVMHAKVLSGTVLPSANLCWIDFLGFIFI